MAKRLAILRAELVYKEEMYHKHSIFMMVLFAFIIVLFSASPVALGDAHGQIISISSFNDGGLTTGSRDIVVYLPENYDRSAGRYSVVYFSDGDKLKRGTWNVAQAAEDLARQRLIEPIIIVGIFNTANGRTVDLTPTVGIGDNYGWGPGGGLEGYYRFISERLKPYIDSNYRTKMGAAYTGIAGSSFGGLAAFIMAYKHPETFGFAGCMSTSFWWDDELELKTMEKDQTLKTNTRLWLDGGLNEYDQWKPTETAYALLEAKGWRPGEDLACYFDYTGAHNDASWNGRTQSMLYFLLHTQPLKFKNYRLVPAWDPSSKTFQLGQGHPPIIGPEVSYANGLRLTNAKPLLTPKDNTVAAVDGADPLLIHIAGPGKTVISSTFNGVTASIKVRSYDRKELPNIYLCPKSDRPWTVGSNLANGHSLPFAITIENKPTAYFGTTHDDKNVYVGIHVIDSSIIASEGVKPWKQDGVSIQFDARTGRALWECVEGWDAPDYLVVELSPGKLGKPIAISTNISELPEELQNKTKIESAIVLDGYNVVVTFPLDYIQQQQGLLWKEFRLNVGVTNMDRPGGTVSRGSWQPFWDSWQNIVGSGIFRRGDPEAVTIAK